MHLNKTLFFLMAIIIFFTGCISLKQKVVSKPAEVVAVASIEIKHGKFDSFLEELKYDCNIYVIEDNDTYLKIGFNTQKDFSSHTFKLTDEAKKSLKCVIPIVLNNQNLSIQIVGHANDSISMPHNRYLSNNRAIVAAELLYKDGVDNIYAKGCPEKKHFFNDIAETDISIDSKIYIYIYANERSVKNPCP